jgi:hypothetical protein
MWISSFQNFFFSLSYHAFCCIFSFTSVDETAFNTTCNVFLRNYFILNPQYVVPDVITRSCTLRRPKMVLLNMSQINSFIITKFNSKNYWIYLSAIFVKPEIEVIYFNEGEYSVWLQTRWPVFDPRQRQRRAMNTLMMEAVSIIEMSVYYNETTRRNIPEGSDFHTCRRENLKSHNDYFLTQH